MGLDFKGKRDSDDLKLASLLNWPTRLENNVSIGFLSNLLKVSHVLFTSFFYSNT